MIESVKKMSNNKYLINDCVVVSEIDVNSTGELICSLSFDESMITLVEAEKLVYNFASEAFPDDKH
jgi:hypothetical protein